MVEAPRRSHGSIFRRPLYIGRTVLLVLMMIAVSFSSPELGGKSKLVFGAKHETNKGVDVFLTKVSFEIEGVRLLDFLENYSETYGFTFFLDRRVDPSTPLTGSCTDEPLIRALDVLLSASQLSFLVVDDSSLLYVGPQEAAGEALLLLARKNEGVGLEHAPQQMVARLFTTIDFQINQFTEPKEVFKSFALRARLKLSGFEKTPFDLYRSARFEKVYIGSVLTILGLGFNVDYRYDEATASFKPVSIDKDAEVSRYYSVDTVKKLKREDYPDCIFENQSFDGKKMIRVDGPFKTVAKIELLLSQDERLFSDISNNRPTLVGETSPQGTNHKQTRISGEIGNASLRNLFAYLQKNANVVCKLDAALEADGVTLESRVSCKFTNADINQIGSIVAKQINATPVIVGNVITFCPK